VEVAASVVNEHDRLAVDHRLVSREAANRLRDPRKTVREVRAAAAPDLHALALFAGEDAEAVVFYFMQPSWSGWRIGDERRFARADEAGRNAPSPAGRWGAPGCVPQVMAMRIMERYR
jgi:hypothetical protein